MYQVPSAFYAVVQLSTWFPNPQLLAELRDQQLQQIAARRLSRGGVFSIKMRRRTSSEDGRVRARREID